MSAQVLPIQVQLGNDESVTIQDGDTVLNFTLGENFTQIVTGGGVVVQEAAPAGADGLLWYKPSTQELFAWRSPEWERLPFVDELNGDFGSITMDGGYF